MAVETVACPNTKVLDKEFWKHVIAMQECRLVIQDEEKDYLDSLFVDAKQRGLPVQGISWIAV